MTDMLRKQLRPDLLLVADLIPHNVKLLDLGCGDGTLIKLLSLEKQSRGLGLERDQNKIVECVANGVPVVHGDLNRNLPFKDKSFDFVILSQTLQAVNHPDLLLREMNRIGKKVIVSFINFGYFRARAQLFFRGRMPVTDTLPDTWYNTTNIHLATIRDFRELCSKLDIAIHRELPVGGKCNLLARLNPNLFASTCVFILSDK